MPIHIPKKMGHIWIGPLQAPKEWMQTWTEKHPDWEYTLYDNAFLATAEFETQPQIDEYIRRGRYAGAADLMQYEILWRYGGVLAPADGVCLRPVDELFEQGGELFTVYENEFVRGKLVSPIIAAAPGNAFLRLLIDDLKRLDVKAVGEPWKQTGNLFVAKMIEKHQPDITIWPSYYLNPRHYTGVVYEGEGPVYAEQHFGSTSKLYKVPSWRVRRLQKKRRKYAKKMREHVPPEFR